MPYTVVFWRIATDASNATLLPAVVPAPVTFNELFSHILIWCVIYCLSNASNYASCVYSCIRLRCVSISVRFAHKSVLLMNIVHCLRLVGCGRFGPIWACRRLMSFILIFEVSRYASLLAYKRIPVWVNLRLRHHFIEPLLSTLILLIKLSICVWRPFMYDTLVFAASKDPSVFAYK